MRKLCFLTIVIMFGIILSGCTGSSNYHLVIKNTGDSEIEKVKAIFDDFDFTFGIIIPKGISKYSSVGEKYSLPKKATIEWQTSDGLAHKRTVEIKTSIPEKFKEITIIISINGENNVAVSWKDGNTW